MEHLALFDFAGRCFLCLLDINSHVVIRLAVLGGMLEAVTQHFDKLTEALRESDSASSRLRSEMRWCVAHRDELLREISALQNKVKIGSL